MNESNRDNPWGRRTLAGLCLALLLPLVAIAQGNGEDRSTMVIETGDGERVTYQVELALTRDQQRTGLMHRQSMPADHGMLFIYEPSREVTMWMKNTLLSLDMLFIDSDGRIVTIREHAEPMSTRLIPSRAPVRGVLELNAGQVEAHGIRAGDRVIHPAFD